MNFTYTIIQEHNPDTFQKQVEAYLNDSVSSDASIDSCKIAICDGITIPNVATIIYNSEPAPPISGKSFFWDSYIYYSPDVNKFEDLVSKIVEGLNTGKLVLPDKNNYTSISAEQAHTAKFCTGFDDKYGIILSLWYPTAEH